MNRREFLQLLAIAIGWRLSAEEQRELARQSDARACMSCHGMVMSACCISPIAMRN